MSPVPQRFPHGSAVRLSSWLFAVACLFAMPLTVSTAFGDDQAGGSRGADPVVEAPSPASFGTYHALIVGIDEYADWPDLRFAERDAKALADILTSSYSFKPKNVTMVLGQEATRANIINTLTGTLRSLQEDDNLLIYYAGHGQLDPFTNGGFWIPADGGLRSEPSWVRFSTLTEMLGAAKLRAKNVAVVTDSCYGGALTRSGPTPGTTAPEANTERYLDQVAQWAAKPSRQIVASGGYEQVPDQSAFATLLRQALKNNDHPVIDLEWIYFDVIYPELRQRGQQNPVLARLNTPRDQNGQFVFVKSQPQAPPAPPSGVSIEVN